MKLFALLFSLLFFAYFCLGDKQATAKNNCSSFTIQNSSTHTIGSVSIVGGGNVLNVNIPTTGTYISTVCFTPASITIAGQTVSFPNSQVVSVADGDIAVDWDSQGVVIFYDYTIENTPAP